MNNELGNQFKNLELQKKRLKLNDKTKQKENLQYSSDDLETNKKLCHEIYSLITTAEIAKATWGYRLTAILSVNNDYIGGYEIEIVDKNNNSVKYDIDFLNVPILKELIKLYACKNACLDDYNNIKLKDDLEYKDRKSEEIRYYEYYNSNEKCVKISENFFKELNSNNWEGPLPQPLIKHNNEIVTSMKAMFSECNRINAIDLSNFDTTNVTHMSWMFFRCNALTELNVSNFNTSNVTSMDWMFCDCRALTTLDVSNFNTSNVTNMGSMFFRCKALTELNVSNFNTSNVTDMKYMFSKCSTLTTLDVSNFNTSNVTNMGSMFYKCSALETLDVSNFNTSNVMNMSHMFCNCSALTTLDVSNFNTSNVMKRRYMFRGCSSLTEPEALILAT
ncbi:hypothetical protein AN644_04740 [Candidatus Epulonipiscium fishelsonii]|nr:hypothetical protein AN644_04740 [Epulopiscium sp. SCG-C06WGA-EpuloA1]